PVEHERVGRRLLGGVVAMGARVEAGIGDPAPLELGEDWTEPVRGFVVDRDRLAVGTGHNFGPARGGRTLLVQSTVSPFCLEANQTRGWASRGVPGSRCPRASRVPPPLT